MSGKFKSRKELFSRRDFLRMGLTAGGIFALSQTPFLYEIGETIPSVHGQSASIVIAPALIRPDCSVAEYLSSVGRPRTSLGKQKESEGWRFDTEWDDTYETVLLPNPNYSPVQGRAYFRAKYDADINRLYAIGIWPLKTTIVAGDILNLWFDTRYSGSSATSFDRLGFWAGWDEKGVKGGWVVRGKGENYYWDDMPSDFKWNCGLAASPYSQNKHLVFKLDVQPTMSDTQELPKKMAVVIGNYVDHKYFTNPQDVDLDVTSTWADGLYPPASQAIPELPKSLGLGIVPITVGMALLFLKGRYGARKCI